MSDSAVVLSRSQVPSVPEALTPDDVMAQVHLIQHVMERAMKKDEHYGVIPGTGNKPTLLKAGAEKLNLTFRMAPDPQVEVIDLGKGHREYRVKVVMSSINSGKILGAGVGSASTMETKWRFRSGPGESTGKPVPKEYWDVRTSDPKKGQELLGGKGYVTKKEDGVWMIFRQGERVEHDNPADYYNTCLKMAKKRALVDAVLTVTAASDIFTQDIEEMVENEVIIPTPSMPPKPAAAGPSPAPAAAAPGGAQPPPAPDPLKDEDEGELRDELWAICAEIGKQWGSDPGAVLYDLTSNKEGKYGKQRTQDIMYQATKKDGTLWSPLKVVLKKAKEELEKARKAMDAL